MKAIFIFLITLVLTAGLWANPALPESGIISEVWFADNGHLMVELCTMNIYDISLNHLTIEHSGYREAFSDSTIIIDTSGVVIDFTDKMPGMSFNPAGDLLCILANNDNRDLYILDSLSWGEGEFVNTHPPLPGQSMARYRNNWDSVWYYHLSWVKDEPPTPGTNCYRPVARSVLKVKVTDQNNDPVPYVFIDYFPNSGLTDAKGELSVSILPQRTWLYVKHPITNADVLYENYWVEPNDTLIVPIQITMPSPYPYTAIKGFHVYPSPFNINKDVRINFVYYGKQKLGYGGYVKLYDTKGRFIKQIGFSYKGTACWRPSSDMHSGMYLARVINGNRIIDTTTFIIIK